MQTPPTPPSARTLAHVHHSHVTHESLCGKDACVSVRARSSVCDSDSDQTLACSVACVSVSRGFSEPHCPLSSPSSVILCEWLIFNDNDSIVGVVGLFKLHTRAHNIYICIWRPIFDQAVWLRACRALAPALMQTL